MANTNHNVVIRELQPTEILQVWDLNDWLRFTWTDFNLLWVPVWIYTLYDNWQKLTEWEDFDITWTLIEFYVPRDNDLITINYKYL